MAAEFSTQFQTVYFVNAWFPPKKEVYPVGCYATVDLAKQVGSKILAEAYGRFPTQMGISIDGREVALTQNGNRWKVQSVDGTCNGMILETGFFADKCGEFVDALAAKDEPEKEITFEEFLRESAEKKFG
jgi:hypothetical protein